MVIRADMEELHKSFSNYLNGITATLNITLVTVEKTLKVAEKLKGGTNDLISKVHNVTSVVYKIASTMQSY